MQWSNALGKQQRQEANLPLKVLRRCSLAHPGKNASRESALPTLREERLVNGCMDGWAEQGLTGRLVQHIRTHTMPGWIWVVAGLSEEEEGEGGKGIGRSRGRGRGFGV